MEKFTAVIEKAEVGWIGFVEELPGANTQGKSKEEVRENLKEAVKLIIDANREITRREIEGKSVIREEFLVDIS